MNVDPVSALVLSLKAALAAAVLGLPLATGLGWLLARGRFRGKALLSSVILAPLVLPPVVTGLLLLNLFGRAHALGAFLDRHGWPIAFEFFGVVVAALVVALPLYVAVVRSAFEAVDPSYEEVSLSLGVRPWKTFVRVTLPLALPGIGAGAMIAFARALGEFGATAVLSGNIEGRTRTLALAVYTLLDVPDGEQQVWVLTGASLALSAGALFAYEHLLSRQRQRLERDG